MCVCVRERERGRDNALLWGGTDEFLNGGNHQLAMESLAEHITDQNILKASFLHSLILNLGGN